MKLRKTVLLVVVLLISSYFVFSSSKKVAIPEVKQEKTDVAVEKKEGITRIPKPKYVRALHLTAWAAGAGSFRKTINRIIDNTEINSLVIAVKEYNGDVYIPGVKMSEEFGAYRKAMPDIKEYLDSLKKKNIYTIARIVLFKDNVVARKRPEWAVKDTKGNIWKDKKGYAWLDPYNKEAWEYNFAIVDRCLELGFDEIQFDYVRFPSDGMISQCRYSQKHSSTTATVNIVNFLKETKERYRIKRGVPISIDVFGLTTSAEDDMGIGQIIEDMAKEVDYICPMVYPSHYLKGVYGIKDPNSHPYETVYMGLKKAREKLGPDYVKVRPYLQDFSLGYKYNAKEVRAQIKASYDNDMPEWTLWSPRVSYNESALKPKSAMNEYENTRVDKSTSTVNN